MNIFFSFSILLQPPYSPTTASLWLISTAYFSNQPAGAVCGAYRLAVATFAGIRWSNFGLHLPRFQVTATPLRPPLRLISPPVGGSTAH